MLLILLSLIEVKGNFCPGYGCSSNPYASSLGHCIFQQGTKYSLSICEDDYYSYCEPSTEDQFCSLPPSHSDLNISYVGEPCTYDRNCVNSICKDNFCTVENPSGACEDNSMCSPGYFCNATQGFCSKLIKLSQAQSFSCSRDSDCDYGCGCHQGMCSKYFSIDAGKQVEICPNGINFLCTSGACIIDRYQGITICMNKTKTQGSLPKACTGDADCVIESSGSRYTTGCNCGINPYSQAYCNLAPGDSDFVNLNMFFKEWLLSKNVANCNTDRRVSQKCIQTYASKQNYARYNYYSQKVNNYTLIQNNDECIKRIFTSEYWQAYETFKSYQTKEKDESFGRSLVVLMGIWLLG